MSDYATNSKNGLFKEYNGNNRINMDDYRIIGNIMYKTNVQSAKISEIDLLLQELRDTIDNQKEEIDRLNNIIDTMLEFSFFKEECPLNFGSGDEKEEKAQDVFYEDDYCEENCNDIYKKCWLKYFEKLQELKENNK